jgi:hypothetical protein
MLSGAPAWRGLSDASIARHVVSYGRHPRLPTALPPALESLLRVCLSFDPEARPMMSEVATALAAWLVTNS